jgi:nicotinamide riboside kinase
MRVYFIGSHSVGKTTLARYVSEEYKLPYLNEAARTILAEKELNVDTLRVNLKIADEYQMAVFDRQLQAESSLESFVSDRSFDNLAYAAQHSTVLSKLLMDERLGPYIDSLREPDVALFFVRPSRATLKQDGVRESLDWDGIISVDAIIKFILQMYQLKYFQINASSMQERVNLISSVLSTFST